MRREITKCKLWCGIDAGALNNKVVTKLRKILNPVEISGVEETFQRTYHLFNIVFFTCRCFNIMIPKVHLVYL